MKARFASRFRSVLITVSCMGKPWGLDFPMPLRACIRPTARRWPNIVLNDGVFAVSPMGSRHRRAADRWFRDHVCDRRRKHGRFDCVFGCCYVEKCCRAREAPGTCSKSASVRPVMRWRAVWAVGENATAPSKVRPGLRTRRLFTGDVRRSRSSSTPSVGLSAYPHLLTFSRSKCPCLSPVFQLLHFNALARLLCCTRDSGR
jgi:hypothetical protein